MKLWLHVLRLSSFVDKSLRTTNNRQRTTLLILFTFNLLLLTSAQDWSSKTDGFFSVQIASSADATYLSQVFEILQQAKKDLRTEGLTLPESILVQIHPNLDSFTTTTELPWYVISVADRETSTIHTQRLRILLERQTLDITLRHELFHLAQPEDWPRWRAEGEAMRFSGESVQAEPFENVTEEELNRLLANPDSRDTLQRAAATAYFWVVQGR
jgi:hypothetical protein